MFFCYPKRERQKKLLKASSGGLSFKSTRAQHDICRSSRFQQRWQSAWRELFRKALDNSKCFNLNYSFYAHLSPRRSSALFMVWRVNVRNQLQFTRNPPILIFAAMTSNKKYYLWSSKLILIMPAHIRVRSFQVALNNLCCMNL